MKLYGTLVYIFFAIMSSSCNKEELNSKVKQDNNGVMVSQPYEWTKPISDGKLIATGIRTSIVWQQNVLFPGWEKGDQIFYMKNSENGNTIWQWNDFLTDFEDWDVNSHYQYESYLVIPDGPRGYCIDLSTGLTVWRKQTDSDLGSLIKGLGRKYFRVGNYVKNENDHFEGVAFMGDVFDNALPHIIVRPPYKRKQADVLGSVGLLTGVIPFINSDTLLLVAYADPVSDKEYNNYLGLYNVSKQVWQYTNKGITSNTLFAAGSLTLSNDRVYLQSSKKLFCYEIATGDKLWQQSFSEGFSDMMLVENKLIANCEDTYLYALDPKTGQQLWKEKSSGTSSPMSYLNGVVYFVGGGDGLLHAVEIATGKHLWRLSSPDLAVNNGAWFKRHVAVLPPEKEGEKGKVLTSSYISAFCYEAAR